MEEAVCKPDSSNSRKFGDDWVVSNRTVVLAVPSAVVPRQINYLLNPSHPDFGYSLVEDQPYLLDVRLFDITPS